MEYIDKNLTIIEKRIKFLRDLKDLTQQEIASELNVTQALINSWENGYNNIPIKQLIKLSYFYQVPVDYILGLTTHFNREDYHFKQDLDLVYLGKKVRIIRKINNLTQEEFASRIKTKRSNISYYEIGKNSMSSADLKDICDTFGFSADWCLGITDICIRRNPKVKIKEEEIKEYINI
ncbi:MAG: helix-turn-helix domain-containing protein [Ruminococcus sp.]|nr:helix-turn-helix domain-containing protein [Ruminococcus sp.]